MLRRAIERDPDRTEARDLISQIEREGSLPQGEGSRLRKLRGRKG